MWKFLVFTILASFAVLLQISFFSQLPFPFSTVSFPIVGIVYGTVRDRPLSAAGWALIGGFLLDVHGVLGFGAELCAFFAAFFIVRFLFQRVVTNAGSGALFLLGAAAAAVHWLVLVILDGANALFGGVPVMIEASAGSVLAPLRQGLVAGAALWAIVALGHAARRRFRKTFFSHASQTFS